MDRTPVIRSLLTAVVPACLAGFAAAAEAYIGPGAGLTAIGTVLALIGAVVLAVFGFVWYPIKRLMARLRAKRADTGNGGKKTGP